MNSYLKRKYIRFFESSKVLKVKYLLHKLFKEKDIGTLELNFQDKPHRSLLVQEIINKKKYNSYLEIGCFSDELFSKIKCKHKNKLPKSLYCWCDCKKEQDLENGYEVKVLAYNDKNVNKIRSENASMSKRK